MTDAVADRRRRFRELHARAGLFVMPNPWDVGSARVLESLGFEALATTSDGFAWAIGKLDQQVSRDELVAHVAGITRGNRASAQHRQRALLSGRSRRDRGDGGPARRSRERRASRSRTTTRRATASTPSRSQPRRSPSPRKLRTVYAEPIVLTGRAENHIRGVDDLDDTIARLDRLSRCGRGRRVRARALVNLDQIAAVVEAVGIPVNVLALRERADDPRSSSPSACAGSRPEARSPVRRTARSSRARSELQAEGTSRYARQHLARRAARRLSLSRVRRAHPKSSSSATGRPSGAAREGTPVAPTFR